MKVAGVRAPRKLLTVLIAGTTLYGCQGGFFVKGHLPATATFQLLVERTTRGPQVRSEAGIDSTVAIRYRNDSVRQARSKPIALIKLVRAALSGGPYYIRLRRDRIVVRNASSGARFDDEPIVAVSDGQKRRILGVGSAARAASATSVNPFQHPRILIADFIVAEALLKHAFHAVSPRSWVQPSPVAVCHVVEPLEGGLSQIEGRALMEMMEGAGAHRAFLWEGRELTDAELLSGAYRPAGS